MILPIVAYGSPVLKKKAEKISKDYPNLKDLIENMCHARSKMSNSLETSSKHGSFQVTNGHFAWDIIEHMGHARFKMSISLETSLNIWVMPGPIWAFRLRHHWKYRQCQIQKEHSAWGIVENLGHAIFKMSFSLETSLKLWVMADPTWAFRFGHHWKDGPCQIQTVDFVSGMCACLPLYISACFV